VSPYEGGSARVSIGEGSFVLSLSLSVGWRAHLALDVLAPPRGEEEFHDGGVAFARGKGERRAPILKERTERERERRDHEKGEQQQQHTHTHIHTRRGCEER
jgi:hypothetical protein